MYTNTLLPAICYNSPVGLRKIEPVGSASSSGVARGTAMSPENEHGTGSGLRGPVVSIRGVGPETAKALQKKGINSIEDLFYYLPSRYEDKRLIRKISELVEGEENVVLAEVMDSKTGYSRVARKRMCRATIADGTGTLIVKWFRFNRRWLTTVCRRGNLLFLSGKITRYGADLQMVHPRVTVMEGSQDVEKLSTIMPVYPDLEGVAQGTLRKVMKEAFRAFQAGIMSMIPAPVETSHGLCGLSEALRRCHFPENELPRTGPRQECLSRVILEEFFLFQIALLVRKQETGKKEGAVMIPGRFYARLIASLPFPLTGGQDRVRMEIERDMALPHPMNRLLQGDVGSGKTICAILAACIALDSGYQAVFMAPTEVLAEQHYLTIHRMLETIDATPVLLRGNMGAGRAEVLEGIAGGDIPVVVGTHALLQEDVSFHRLGLAVIDEQHRFGVRQRDLLRRKGILPHVLVMSATPIPRTLSMVVYGDLDVSVIDEMPLGRQPVLTEVVTEGGRRRAYDAVREETGKGRQVFVVYPVREESERTGLMSAKESVIRFRDLFPSLRVGLLHGKMRAEEKEGVMAIFKEGRLDILVCTTVVEVGIDVPNASLMIVEHAERFGLSQLHQLRGRVGRGAHQSRCILVSASERTAIATKRLRVLEKTGDGFVVADEDMKLRGPGDMLGVRQAGIPDFRVGDVIRDGDLMTRARKMAEEALASADAAQRDRLDAAATEKWGKGFYLGDVL